MRFFGFRDRDRAHRRDHAPLTVLQIIDLVEAEGDGLEAGAAELIGVMQSNEPIVFPRRKVAIHLGQERAAAARQELRRVGRVLDRMAEHEAARPAGQPNQAPQLAGVLAQLGVAVLVVAKKMGGRCVDDDEIKRTERFDLRQQRVGVEGARNEDDVAGAVTAENGIIADNAHPHVIGIFADQIGDPAARDLVPVKKAAAVDELGNAERDRGLSVAGLPGERIDEAALQNAVDQVVRRDEVADEISLAEDLELRRRRGRSEEPPRRGRPGRRRYGPARSNR